MEKIVWSLEHRGRGKVSLRKGSPFYAEGKLTEEGTYTLEVLTDEDRKGPVAVRSIKVRFVLVFNDDIGDPVSVTKSVHCKRQRDTYSFALPPGQKVFWQLEASTLAILKSIIFHSTLRFSPGYEELKEQELVEKPIAELQLTSTEKAKVDEVMQTWPNPADYNHETTFPLKVKEELSRDSVWKQRAFELGLIRPFLLFVSMDPKTRLQWSLVLKIDIISKSYYGDSHRESYKLLVRKQKGLQPRASHAFTESVRPLKPNPVWYQILHRVCRKATSGTNEGKEEMKLARKTFEKALDVCTEANNEQMFHLEELFSTIVRNIALEKLQEEDPEYYLSLRQRIEREDVGDFIEKLKYVGYTDEALMKYIAITSMVREEIANQSVDKWADSKKEGTTKNTAMIVVPIVAIGAQLALGVTSPLTVVPALMLVRNTAAFVFRETPGRLLSPLLALMKQKDVLAHHNIKVDDYYT